MRVLTWSQRLMCFIGCHVYIGKRRRDPGDYMHRAARCIYCQRRES